jgi:ABC-type sugar transport system permease subunit
MRSTETIPILTWTYGFESFQLGLASAAAIILFVLILLMAMAYFRVARK